MDALPQGAVPSRAWQYTVPLGRRLWDFYPSLGDVTVSANTAVTSTLDGPIQVVRYGTLTVNAALTAANRCRGLFILCDNLIMGASGNIHMDGAGAAGSPQWAMQDITIPSQVRLRGASTSLPNFLAWIRSTGFCICDPTLMLLSPPGMGDVQSDYTSWPGLGTTLVSATGCGQQTTRAVCVRGTYADGTLYTAAPAGNSGANAPGGGGGGGWSVKCPTTGLAMAGIGSTGSYGLPWGGGIGGLVGTVNPDDSSNYSGTSHWIVGLGDADGDPYSSATYGRPGGVLLVLVRGNVTLAPGHSLSASATSVGVGAGHGGGRVVLGYGGSLTGSPALAALGGVGATNCGNGGAGATTLATLSVLGLA